MTINDQIRVEKLQYNINRAAAKIPALSSGKIHKYEYLTGEDILPCNQQHIIKQTKVTYSSLGNAFEKQIKTIEDHGEKQINALKDLKRKEQTKAITEKLDDDDDDRTSTSKEIYDEILEERTDEILKMSKEISHVDLVYNFKGPVASMNLGKYGGPMYIYGHMKNGEKRLQQVEEEQKKCKKDLTGITSGNSKHKSVEQSYTIKNVRTLYDSRQKIIDLVNNNAKTRSEATDKSK